jgi:archaellum component FlaC
MQDSGVFDSRFLRDWETKPDNEKTWNNMTQYYMEEYRTIQRFGGPNKKTFETINNIEDDGEVSEYFEQFRRDAMVNSEQIQQMASSFKGAAETMAEVMDRLKAAQEEIKTLNRTVENLTKSNATLTNTNTAGTASKGGKGTNPNSERCPICNMIHGMPF